MIQQFLKRSFGYGVYTWSTSLLSGSITKSASKFNFLEGKIQDIKFGLRHNGLLDDQGWLFLWGENDFGQLGLGPEN